MENKVPKQENIVTPKESKSIRELALEWWVDKIKYPSAKEKLTNEYYKGRHFTTLTGREIEVIWVGEGKAMEALESKSDNVEDVASQYSDDLDNQSIKRNGKSFESLVFKAGVQWQKERSFTIEEIKDALKQWTEQCTSGLSPRFTEYLLSDEWKNLKK